MVGKQEMMGFSTLYKSSLTEELNMAFRKYSVHAAGKYLSGVCQMKIQGKGQFEIYLLIRYKTRKGRYSSCGDREKELRR